MHPEGLLLSMVSSLLWVLESEEERARKEPKEGIALILSPDVSANTLLQIHHFCKRSVDENSGMRSCLTARETGKCTVWGQKHTELQSVLMECGRINLGEEPAVSTRVMCLNFFFFFCKKYNGKFKLMDSYPAGRP